MDIAVLSDIHSNYIALKTCIDYILSKNITHFIFLGDYSGDCPYPRRSLEICINWQLTLIVILSEGTEKNICLHHNVKTQFMLLQESSKGWDETYIN